MSTENNTPVESTDEDLDLFSSEFFSQKPLDPEPANSETEEAVSTEDNDAPNDTQDDDEEDTLAPEDDADEEEVQEEPAPKKNRFQERIDELTAKAREAERREQAMQAKLDEIISKQNEKPVVPATPVVDDGPTPDAKNEDGTDKYPLGEFDPNYLKDSMRHMLQQEKRSQEEQEKARKEQEAQDDARAEMYSQWNEKLTPAKEKYPDFEEKGQALLSTFENIDAAYGEFLTATLMSMDYGPDVLYYLSNNPAEAQRIVDSGPTRANIALGRIEAKFADFEETKQTVRPKVSKAPTPPPTNKGASPAAGSVSVDTDDLDAFANLLFKKGK